MSSLTIKVKPSYNHALTHHQLEDKNEKGFYSSIYPKYKLIFGSAFTSHKLNNFTLGVLSEIFFVSQSNCSFHLFGW